MPSDMGYRSVPSGRVEFSQSSWSTTTEAFGLISLMTSCCPTVAAHGFVRERQTEGVGRIELSGHG